ncbi:MAG TPA: ATP-grasp domain-containing protein [Gemmataceae bacterium]|nr:ATP-grasp domain-containing protein [Gemmataceae bacterium]
MTGSCNLLIFGASTRAAAFSALRAGLTPTCADLFADADLEARCPVIRVPPDQYPQVFVQVAGGELPGPWIYTGGLEKRPALVGVIAERRPLWGIGPGELARVRPIVSEGPASTELTAPKVWRKAGIDVPPGRWLLKPLAGAGGTGIRHWFGSSPDASLLETHYLQEFIEGESRAAIYVGNGRRAWLVGVTRQLVGEVWLHAAPFHYCGSVGPLCLEVPLREAFERIGAKLIDWHRLRGLFGVDCIVRNGIPWPVEVNPRYTASVEVLEYGAGVPALALHRAVFDPHAPPAKTMTRGTGVVGKAILFARAPLAFPADGPWTSTLHSPGPVEEMPSFADIPHAGERIEARKPILTFFTRADSETACMDQLKAIAADLDHWLFER